MNEMTVLMVALGLVVLVGLPMSAHGEEAGERGVSLIQLIANPTSFDGRRVAVTGYVVLEFEHTAVYLHETDATYGISRNGLWLDVPVGSDSHRARFHRRYVSIEGTFSAQRRGHRGAFSGTIEHVSGFDAVEPRPGPLVPAPH